MSNQDSLYNLPRSREEAQKAGSTYFFTGKPCKYGHVDKRATSNKNCRSCLVERSRKYNKENREYILRCSEQYRKDNADFVKKIQKNWRDDNRDHIKEYNRYYLILNREKIRIYSSNHRARKKNATPRWVDWGEIEYIYKLASEKGLEVDHIVPMNSDYVCGLHTGDNLRCISKELNSYKGNRYWPDMPEELIKEVFE